MTKINSSNIKNIDRCVACIGYFDGVHLGHQELINRTIKLAKQKNIKANLICFNPSPIDVISGIKSKHIYSYEDRNRLIKYLGINDIIEIRFNKNLMKISPIEFINNYLNRMNIDTLICGFDFSFGYMGKGNTKTLRKYGNFKLEVIDEIKYYNKKISSTRIKNAIVKGNFKFASKLLGFDYYLQLKVVKCSRNGSNWLIQAKTKYEDVIVPNDGEYADNLKILNEVFYLDNISKMKTGEDFILVL